MTIDAQRHEELELAALDIGYGCDIIAMKGFEVPEFVSGSCRGALGIEQSADVNDLSVQKLEELDMLMKGVRGIVCLRRQESRAFVARALLVADQINKAGNRGNTG
ncbi:MAG: hypothetical protein ABI221_01145 [Candidatus Saccharimonadales bacterium]